MAEDKGFKPAQRKILVASADEPDTPTPPPDTPPPEKKPAVKTVASAVPVDPPKLPPLPKPELESESEPETTTKPLSEPTDDKTSFPPAGTAETLPAVDVEALRRQYHIPVGRMARKFRGGHRWSWLIVVLLVLIAAAMAAFVMEPEWLTDLIDDVTK